MRLIVLGAALALAGCGSGYDAAYERAFMEHCQTSGGSEAVCACAFERIEAEIPRADMDSYEAAIDAGDQQHPLTPRLRALTLECAAAERAADG